MRTKHSLINPIVYFPLADRQRAAKDRETTMTRAATHDYTDAGSGTDRPPSQGQVSLYLWDVMGRNGGFTVWAPDRTSAYWVAGRLFPRLFIHAVYLRRPIEIRTMTP